ncbi:MAG TPA: hypothetical protein VMZ27_13090 [Candidatus Saccharimonadales bacterium]|nr:hypothetical protein [Candidatus Saccharimonadales bacterium]
MAKTRSKNSPKIRINHGCVALIQADGTAVRKKVSHEYEKAKREIERVRAELRRFETEDKPLFKGWLHREFGSILTSCRETDSKIQQQQEVLFQVEEAIIFDGISPQKAYEQVIREQSAAAEAAEEDTNGKADDREREGADSKEKQRDFFGSFGEDEGQFHPRSKFRPPERQKGSRLKELYRLVVRQLHPDLQREMTPQKTEWWHQAQAAYEQEDTDQLEIILALCEIEETHSTRHTSLSILQRVTAALKLSLRPVKSELRKHQGEASWGFSKKQPPELIALRAKFKASLEAELAAMKQELAEIEETLASYKAKRGKRRPRNVNPFDFMFGR